MILNTVFVVDGHVYRLCWMSLIMLCTCSMVYLDFSKAFDKVDHGILLHKVKEIGITGKLGQWLYHFLTNRKHFVRLPGGLSGEYPVISGVITSSKLISVADDTRLYNQISDTEDCDSLQRDLNSVYKWASENTIYLLVPPKLQTKVISTLIPQWTTSHNLQMFLTLG